ncbi:tax1 binding protein-related [Holotrichia oblita]|uniref:Tax1 binding protein-related n=1 Tax=Holotrichia oblita TaxID=644536 RepID=A0ACB9TQ89_HOLOL|nr:tax1 binding protein-related [Holotrichia oblita]
MSEKDYAPLSLACVKTLHDKLYEKRKIAALEIEKMVKEFAAVDNTMQIKKLLKVLGEDFATSQNPHVRKGGLLGLAATSIALGKQTSQYTDELIKPILACFQDADLRVRYYACESLYNVVKVARSAVLPHFSAIFNALNKISTDPEQSVKNASELLDRLLKDIVTESTSFDLEGFMPLLRERIFTKSSFARQFVISWISVLDAVPDIDLIIYLPEILDGLFKILNDPSLEVKKMCETVLGEFLRSIKKDPARVNFGSMINILITHAQDKCDDVVQLTAITWIKEFVQLSGPLMLPYMSGIFTAILPCLAYDSDSRRMTDIKETATAVNFTMLKLVALQANDINISGRIDMGAAEVEKYDLNLPSVVDVLTQFLLHNSVQTKVAVLRWIHHLYTQLPQKMCIYIDLLFPVLQRTLSDPADEVVQQCLVVIAEVISTPRLEIEDLNQGKSLIVENNIFFSYKVMLSNHDSSFMYIRAIYRAGEMFRGGLIGPERTYQQIEGDQKSRLPSPYYSKFVVSLLQSFSADPALLEERGSFIIRQLCVLLNAEDIYRTLAQILLNEPNLKFASLMVEHLNFILLTSSELFDMRTKLKNLDSPESCTLFCCLYETWCHNPVATVALCLLTQCYNHVCDLIMLFLGEDIDLNFKFKNKTNSGNLEVTKTLLTEIDKLVRLIESPIFAYLRLELLKVPADECLVRALYGLLMLLPQTEAFAILKTRLSCIPSLHLHCDKRNQTEIKPVPARMSNIDFPKLLERFKSVQENHREYKKAMRAKDISSLDKDISNLDI